MLLGTAAFLSLGMPAARAIVPLQRTYWDPGLPQTGTAPGSGGSGVWDLTTPNWISTSGSGDVAYPNTSSNPLTYFAGAAGTVNLNAGNISAPYVEFDTAGYVLQDAPGTSYALAVANGSSSLSAQIASGTVTVSLPVNASSTLLLDARTGGTLAVTGNLTVGSGLYVNNGSGGGTVVLSGNNALSGLTRVENGTLRLAGTGTNQPVGGTTSLSVNNHGVVLYGASNQVPASVPVEMFANGTINVNGQNQDRAHAFGALTLSSSYAGDISVLDFGSGATTGSVLAFDKSSGIAWSGTLNVYDYQGTPGAGGGVDRLFFGTDATGLTASQLGEISFYSGGAGSTFLGSGVILSNGEVTYVAVPEPATWLGGFLLALGATRAGWPGRRRPRPQV